MHGDAGRRGERVVEGSGRDADCAEGGRLGGDSGEGDEAFLGDGEGEGGGSGGFGGEEVDCVFGFGFGREGCCCCCCC